MTDEAQTRQELIDERLRLAGWDVHDASQVIQELDIHLAEAGIEVEIDPTNLRSGHQFADYALVLNGKPVAVVEATGTIRSDVATPIEMEYVASSRKAGQGPLRGPSLYDAKTANA